MIKLLKNFECMHSLFLRKSSVTGCPCCNHSFQSMQYNVKNKCTQDQITAPQSGQRKKFYCKFTTGIYQHSCLSQKLKFRSLAFDRVGNCRKSQGKGKITYLHPIKSDEIKGHVHDLHTTHTLIRTFAQYFN